MRKWLKRFKQLTCKHCWRPAFFNTATVKYLMMPAQPARFCEVCRKVEVLSVEQFYAYFGRMPQL